MTGARGQRGVALVTALLAVAIVTVLAVEMVSDQYLDIRRTRNLLARDQAYAYGLSAERWALQILIEDRRQSDGAVDHPNEPWAREITPPPFEGARLRLRMEDLQGRFNINNLVTAPGMDNTAAMECFSRLLHAVGVEPDFVQAAADWVDYSPQIRFPDGAGDDWYSRLEPPYRAANRPMRSATELRLVRGVEDGDWRRVAPYVTALTERTLINVNTASPALLRCLTDDLSADAAERLVQSRPDNGWQSVQDFVVHPALAGQEVDTGLLSVSSQYFLLRSEISLGRVTIRNESILHRQDGGSGRVVLRRQGFFD